MKPWQFFLTALPVALAALRAFLLGAKEIVEALLVIALFVALVLHMLHILGYLVPDILSDLLRYAQWPN